MGIPGERWNRVALQLQADARLGVLLVLVLQVSRAALVLFFRDRIAAASGPGDLARVALTGLRYDVRTAAIALLPSILAGIACGARDWSGAARRVRRWTGAAFVPLAVALAVVDVGFFREYDDQFNHFVVNLLYEDNRAVLGTILAEYHVPESLAAILAGGALGLLALPFFLRPGPLGGGDLPRLFPGRAPRVAASIAAASVLAFALRGSVGIRPVQERDAAVTADPFLNKTVLNPPTALWYAVVNHLALQRTRGLEVYLPDGDVEAAARRLFPGREPGVPLEGLVRRTAGGPRSPAPRHVYLVLMESYDSWPMLPAYRGLRLTERLRAIADEGLSIPEILPASDGTMKSLAAIVTGLPESGLRTSFQPAARRAYATSLPAAFHRLGYRTRLFYGGFLGWERLEELARSQGFDEVYGAPHIPGAGPLNEWGVDDGTFFRFVASKVSDERPTFNLLLSTGYHSPHTVDVYAKGYPVREVPPELRTEWDGRWGLRDLGHLWYADLCLGDFVRGTAARLPRALFAITGDHSARKFINGRPTFHLKSVVPLVLYGPGVLAGRAFPPGTAGSHHDIGTTLIELAAPAGFAYHALGRDLLGEAQGVALGLDAARGAGWIADLRAGQWFPVPGEAPPAEPPDLRAISRRHDDLHGLAWWLVRNNPAWPGGGAP